MTRFQLFFVGMGAVWAASGVLAACGGDDNNTTDASDSGGGQDVKKPDVVQPDAGEGGTDVHPAGTQLAASDLVQIFGVTSDDDVIYADGSQNNALYAVPAAGGTPVKIGAPTGFAVGIYNKTVFVWGALTTKGVGALSIWEHGGVLTAITGAGKSAPNGGFAASPDGQHILYTANSDVNGAVGDFVGAKADNSGQTTLVTGVDVASGNNCRPEVGFLNDGEAVTSTCTVTPPDGGTPSATITAYAITTTWTPTQIATGALNFWSTDTAGDKLLTATTTAVSICSLAGVCTPLDATKNIFNGPFTFGFLARNGATAYYTTAAGDFHRVDTTVPVPAIIQAANVNFVRSLSQDEKYVLYTKTFDTQQFGGDLYLTSTAAGAPAATTLVGNQTGALFGVSSLDDFTADSAYVVWIQNLNTSQGIGDLYAVPVAGGTPKQYATGEWQNATATGTKIVFNDNCGGCSGTGGTGNAYADLRVVDVATSNAPATLQKGADVPLAAGGNSIYLDKAKTHVIYSYSQNAAASSGVPASGGNGLYAIAIP